MSWVPESVAREAVSTLLRFVEDARTDSDLREGLQETPKRVVASYKELFGGYSLDPREILEKTFEDEELNQYDQMIIVKDIPFYSTCEHHMIPFFGTADIGYIPDKKVVGLSKLARLLDCFSRRLQVQERITHQVTAAIDEVLQPRGAMCVVRAEHLCMCARGIKKPGSVTVTSSITGVFREDKAAREEFLFLARSKA